MNQLREKYPKEVEAILAKYPPEEKRSAVMPLLYLAQRADGHVRPRDMADIAEICGVSSTHVASIVGFYTLYYDKQEGKYRIQVCNDLPCALRGADQFLAGLCEALGIEPKGTTDDGFVTVEPVMCLAACDKAPMFQLQSSDGIFYGMELDGKQVRFENMTVEQTIEVVQSLRKQTS